MKQAAAFFLSACLLISLHSGVYASGTQDRQADENIKGSFIRIGPVYPFSDLNRLTECADTLSQMGVPFVCEAAPIFYNTDFPAMTKFCAALRYVTAKGGAVVMRRPNVNARIKLVDSYEDKAQIALDAYHENGVYPVRIDVTDDWVSYAAEYDLQSPSDEFIGNVAELLKKGEQIDNLYYKAPQPESLKPNGGEFICVDREYAWKRGFESIHKENISKVESPLQGVVIGITALFLVMIIVSLKMNKSKFARKAKPSDTGKKRL